MAFASGYRSRWQATLAFAGSLLLWWRMSSPPFAIVATVTFVFACLAWLAPAAYAPVQRGFDFVLHLLLTGITWVLLAMVFCGVFVPIRLWRTMTRREPFPLRPDRALATYFQPVPPPTSNRFDRQF